MRQRKLRPLPDDARFGAWRPGERVVAEPEALSTSAADVSQRSRWIAVAALTAAAVLAIAAPRQRVLGPRFSASRARAAGVADSMLRARGLQISSWKRILGTTPDASDTLRVWRRFLRDQKSEGLADSLAKTYAIPTWWAARYVRVDGPLSSRAEEWRARIRPDGVPIDWQHVIPDSAPGATPKPDDVRAVARFEIARAGIDTTALREIRFEETARPARHDINVTYADTTVHLPGGAIARVRVSFAGAEPVLVRRDVELTERFLRDDRDRLMTRMIIAAFSALLLISLMLWGAVFVIRRRPAIVEEAALRARVRIWIVVALWAVLL